MKEAIDWYVLFYCSGFGLCAGFFISLLSEYFTSMNCPPSQQIAESSKKGIPVNLLRSSAYANMFSVLSLFLLLGFVYLSVYYGGGLGFTYGLMGLIAY